jgi:hypothetical protein
MITSDPHIARLRLRIEKAATALKEAFARKAKNAEAKAKLQSQLEAARGERTRHEERRSQLENASALALHRMGLTNEEALSQSDELQGKIDAILNKEQGLSSEIDNLNQAYREDDSVIQSTVKPLVDDSELLTQAELIALLCSMITEVDVPYQIDHNWNLYRATKAATIHSERKRRMTNDFWSVAAEVAENPIVALEQAPAVVPNAQSSAVVRQLQAA